MIIISANRGLDDEPWRLDRMYDVYKSIREIEPELFGYVERLHDHKGGLTVWLSMGLNKYELRKLREAIAAAWKNECENEDEICYWPDDRLFVGDGRIWRDRVNKKNRPATPEDMG